MNPIIVWFRGDLRIKDNPALFYACQSGAPIIPFFILDPYFLSKKVGSNRNRFLLESLRDLQKSLDSLGAKLIIRQGMPEQILPAFMTEVEARAVFFQEEVSLYSRARDNAVVTQLKQSGHEKQTFGGSLLKEASLELRTGNGQKYKMFTPFWKAWEQLEMPTVLPAPARLITVPDIPTDTLPSLESVTIAEDLSPESMQGGETFAWERFEAFLAGPIHTYHEQQSDLAADATSKMSPYLHFGCISPRSLAALLPDGPGPDAWRRQLVWRDFYKYILAHFPNTTREPFQESYRNLKWQTDQGYLHAWQQGQTGYPIVDAAMRQLQAEGFMHNRARLIVGSFLTKHLWCDWRVGEEYFMKMLVDGDRAQNVGNWQWIASIGVDPAPVFKRLYNPTLQSERHDPNGDYIRRYIPELRAVPDVYIHEPSKMPLALQHNIGVHIGEHYPQPIVEHREARAFALQAYRTQRDM